MLSVPLQMFLAAIAGWISQHQRLQLEFAQEQVRVYQELNGGKRLIDGVSETRAGPVKRNERLGGLRSSYYREAA